ncbi:MAG: hypothetical protein DRR16_26835 [Candidatus Parabeggiatoa sp. nov. 3]|nr:MAG: hypothetical protein DRR00_28625 [Gammaproteobacteria bacterium]RKZ58170.1 MAG: hypothetical protein DRQ99_25865 [Gammaproteobacteria bacterium]RKZ78885.1 MAG: hypothetical protein DRR16_26835 [Gammaproteobacteria bacterium]HEW98136.1 hypothetical protein [Beggiatoa sp.]
MSLERVDHQVERTQIAKLYLMAGQKAKAANAYEAAIQYLRLGQACLAKNSWEREYDLTLNLYVETLEAAYLNGNPEQANKLSEIVLQQAQTLLDRIKVYQPQIQYYITQNQMQEAIDIGLEVLNRLDIALFDSPPQY